MGKENLIILFSGGADSTLLVEMALSIGLSPVCIAIDYGQKHIAELKVARNFCTKKQIRLITTKIADFNVHSKLVDGVEAYKGVSEWHVPSRNMLFVSIAASYAESMGIDLIWYGANYEDREHLFPDCYQEWVYAMNKILAINGSTQIKLEAPLLGFDKATIKRFLNKYNINISKTFSGYGKIE